MLLLVGVSYGQENEQEEAIFVTTGSFSKFENQNNPEESFISEGKINQIYVFKFYEGWTKGSLVSRGSDISLKIINVKQKTDNTILIEAKDIENTIMYIKVDFVNEVVETLIGLNGGYLTTTHNLLTYN
jgi:hypothetical protein